MDEPLSNLDAKLRVQMRAELISLHQRVGITTIYVTHDQTEAMTLGDRVVVMNHGVVQQVDTPDRLYREPANIFVAAFIGSPAMNLFEGTVDGGALRLGSHRFALTESRRAAVNGSTRDVVVGLRPEDFVLAGEGDTDSLSAVVQIVEQLGPEVIVHLQVDGIRPAALQQADELEGEAAASPGQSVVARFEPTFAARPGDRVRLMVDSARFRFFDPTTGDALGDS